MARNGLVDYCRLVAVLGIVWFHTEVPGERVGYIALPVFLIFLTLASHSSLSNRTRRLLVPFLVWSGIFASLRMFSAYYTGGPLFSWVEPRMILTGTSIHLWFLPFAFLVAVVAPVLQASRVVVVLPMIAAGVMAVLPADLPVPWYQWTFALVPVLTGFAFTRIGLLALLPLAASFAILEGFRPSPDNITILAGSAVGLLVLSLYLPASRLSAYCARLSLWVYLSHPIVTVLAAGSTFALQDTKLGLVAIAGSLALGVWIDLVVRVAKGLQHS